MTLTSERIHAVADQLSDSGVKPTLAAVRKALGSGSFTTIGEAMKSWRQENEQEEVLQQVDLPGGIDDRLKSLGAEIWQTAIGLANDRLSKERELLETARQDVAQEVDELSQAVQTLEIEQSELLRQLDELEKSHSLKLQQLKSKGKADSDTITKLNKDVQEQSFNSKTLQEENSKLNKQLVSAEKALKDEKTTIVKLTVERDSFKDKAETSSAELLELKLASDTIKVSYASLQGEYKAVSNERNRLLKSNKDVLKSHTIIELENQKLVEKYNSMFPKFTLSDSSQPSVFTNSLFYNNKF